MNDNLGCLVIITTAFIVFLTIFDIRSNAQARKLNASCKVILTEAAQTAKDSAIIYRHLKECK